MAKRSNEEREEERKKELLRTLRRGPDLDQNRMEFIGIYN